jgi:endonuclease/exonuclease/phosphatase (EEP) superfamily protein YafD
MNTGIWRDCLTVGTFLVAVLIWAQVEFHWWYLLGGLVMLGLLAIEARADAKRRVAARPSDPA